MAKRRSPPRASADPPAAQAARHSGPAKHNALWLRATLTGALLLTLAALGTVLVAGKNSSHERRIDREVGALLAGIPQKGQTLGASTAPVTMQVFAELEDPTTTGWLQVDLPAIIAEFVRIGRLKIEYRSFKTNTIESEMFVKQQAAALAAGEQDKLWEYVYIFSLEQGKLRTPYATEGFLDNIAHQVPSLDIARWDEDRNADPRIEQVIEEDQQGRADGIHVTPAYRIGRTGGALKNFAGSASHVFADQTHPTTWASAEDVAKAIARIHNKRRHIGSRARQARREETQEEQKPTDKAAERARTSR